MVPAVSVLTVVGPKPVREVMTDSASVGCQVTAASPVRQPSLPTGPVTVEPTVGGLVSRAAITAASA